MEQITLDLIPNGSMPVLHASQYDDGRQWKVNLKENGEDYTLSDETIVLDVRKGDGCAVTCAVAVESGKKYVILTSTEQMCAVAGQNLAELQITKGNMKIGTLNFILQVERDPLNGSISSSSEIHDLQHQVDECVDNALADLGASGLPYDNTESGLEATNVQQAIDEVNAKASGLPSDVYTKEETDALLAEKADKADVYDKDYMNGIFEQIDNAFTGVNNALATKANSADVYNKTYIDTALSAKANANTVYTKAETDAKVAGLIDDTARADDKTWSSNKIFQMFTVEDEASGAIARFNTDLTENLLSAVAEFSASQASGTPTPSAPIPIVGVDKVNFTRCGKNLANIFVDGKVPSTSTGALVSAGGARTDFISCKANTKYTLTCENSQPLYVFFYDDKKSFLSYVSSSGTSYTITTPATARYIMLRFGTNTVTNGMFEESETATTYEPYNGTTALINLGGTYYGGEVDAVTGKITLTHEILVYDGTENGWNKSSTYNGSFYLNTGKRHLNKNAKCSHAEFVSSLGSYAFGKFALDGNGYVNLNAFVQGTGVDLPTFKAWLATEYANGTPLTATLELETPIVVYASNTAEIPTLNGFNQVFADTGDVAVKYLESIKSYIDNKLA